MGKRFVVFALLVFSLAPRAVHAADATPESLLQAGHFKRLRAWAEPRYAANANDMQAAYYLATAREAFGDLNGALPLAEKVLASNANDPRYHLLVADICIEQAQKSSTFKALGLARRFRDEASKAASLDPKYIDPREALSEFYFEAPAIAGGDKKKAWDLADEIGRIDAARGMLARASLAGKEKDPSREKEYLQKALAAAPHDPKVVSEAALFYASDSGRQYDQAEKLALEAMRLDQGTVQPYVVLAEVYASLQRWNDLDATLNQSRKNVPDDLAVYYQAGKVLLGSGKDLPRAELYLRTYLTMDTEAGEPPLAAGRWRLGQVLEKENKKSEAIAELQEALRLQPDFKEAKDDLKRLKD
jgi:tetratricopeptide (TPR) repeat protein